MPLKINTSTAETIASALTSKAKRTNTPAYAIIYASLTNGVSWCGDCRRAEGFVKEKFEGEREVEVVYAGQREVWRRADNPWRAPPWGITNLPTLVKVSGDGKWERLVEEDVYDQKKLDAFVDT